MVAELFLVRCKRAGGGGDITTYGGQNIRKSGPFSQGKWF